MVVFIVKAWALTNRFICVLHLKFGCQYAKHIRCMVCKKWLQNPAYLSASPQRGVLIISPSTKQVGLFETQKAGVPTFTGQNPGLCLISS